MVCTSPCIAAQNIAQTSVPVPVDHNNGSFFFSSSGWNMDDISHFWTRYAARAARQFPRSPREAKCRSSLHPPRAES